jgi:hypothetical protein
MCTVKGLLDCAESNLTDPSTISAMIAKAQIRQYKELIAAGATDDDDVDEMLEKYPECNLKLD